VEILGFLRVKEDDMAKPLVTDDLWQIIQPLIPPHPPRPRGGRPPLDDRKALTGILFVLKTGIPWEDLPQEMGCGSGMTCWRRLRDWDAAGVWTRLHEVLLARLRGAGKINWARAVVDSASVRAVFGGPKAGPALWIAGRTAPSITSSPTRAAFPWPARSAVPTGMM
jgi:transposase